jgi:Arc/MetJ-type ribon-helix-helix transcriptional regulator
MSIIEYYTHRKKKIAKSEKILYPWGMANSPHPQTVTVSFTLPKQLSAAVDKRARQSLTNRSDIIRRALLAYLPRDEADSIMTSYLAETKAEYKTNRKETKP